MVSPTTAVPELKTRPILLLRLEGPLQSWGIRSRWDVRDTAPAPTKSGLIGLLGCALGYERGDQRLRELEKSLRLGVRVEHPGHIVTDYQTITDYLPSAGGDWKARDARRKSPQDLRDAGAAPATIISPRAYLEDAAFLAAFEQTDGEVEILRECASALQSPRWPLFLGRKSCVPTRPIFDDSRDGLCAHYTDIENALAVHPWDWRGGWRQVQKVHKHAKPLRTYVEDAEGSHSWQDTILPGSARFYGFRNVRESWVPFESTQRAEREEA